MSLFIALAIGITVGTAGGYLFLRSPDYILINILVGIVGAILGLAAYALAAEGQGALFSWGGSMSTLLGAVVLELVFVGLQSFSKRKDAGAG